MDTVITDKKETGTMPRHSKVKRLKGSAVMLGMATNAGPSCCGTSSVFNLATTWKMEILKYADLLSFTKDNPYVPTKLCQIKKQERGNIRALCSPFVKVEHHSRVCGNEIIPLPGLRY